jgi:hypothetical protein
MASSFQTWGASTERPRPNSGLTVVARNIGVEGVRSEARGEAGGQGKAGRRTNACEADGGRGAEQKSGGRRVALR